jgi:hypothetical protein
LIKPADASDRLKRNIEDVLSRIETSAKKAGKKAEDITLIAVTKTVPSHVINAALDLGITHIGENRVQELMSKYDELNLERASLHMIGNLQSNKVKYIIDKVAMIQSLTSISSANEIDRQAKKIGRVTDCLIEVNIGSEGQKTGVSDEDYHALIEAVTGLSNINLRGLMCIPPYGDEPTPYFEHLYELHERLRSQINTADIISMGMSDDFEKAILCGSNMVRVGSAIFK